MNRLMLSRYTRPALILSLILFPALPSLAQKTIISGKIHDSETGEPIPYVNLGFQHSLVGTISETDGSFYLSTPKASDTLLVSSVGYELQKVPIAIGKEQVLDLRLVPMSIALEAVVVGLEASGQHEPGFPWRARARAQVEAARHALFGEGPPDQPDGLRAAHATSSTSAR